MIELLRLLAGTVQLRPYVFIFFACYLFLAVTHMGWRKTVLYTVFAYLIAFACEFSSVHNGFPFGLYHYVRATRDRELWIAGVPFMDSLSFTFMSYISWELANLFRSPSIVSRKDVQVISLKRIQNSWATAALAGTLMMYLDIIIDPLTLRGSKWFLGQIYYYPDGGVYFGVPISNFLGWWFVGFVIVRVFSFIEQRLFDAFRPEPGVVFYRYKAIGAPILYFGVLGFNLAVTFCIGERLLATAGTFIALCLLLLLLVAVDRNKQPGASAAIEEHLRDYRYSPLR